MSNKGQSSQKAREKWQREHIGYTRSSWSKEKRQKRLEKRLKRNENKKSKR